MSKVISVTNEMSGLRRQDDDCRTKRAPSQTKSQNNRALTNVQQNNCGSTSLRLPWCLVHGSWCNPPWCLVQFWPIGCNVSSSSLFFVVAKQCALPFLSVCSQNSHSFLGINVHVVVQCLVVAFERKAAAPFP